MSCCDVAAGAMGQNVTTSCESRLSRHTQAIRLFECLCSSMAVCFPACADSAPSPSPSNRPPSSQRGQRRPILRAEEKINITCTRALLSFLCCLVAVWTDVRVHRGVCSCTVLHLSPENMPHTSTLLI